MDATLAEDVPTVVVVRWDPGVGEADRAWVRYGRDRDLGREAPAWPGEDGGFEAWLVGLPPETDVWLEPVIDTGGRETTAALTRVETGPAPPELPDTEVIADDLSAVDQGFLVTTVVFTPPAAVILDREGNYVWWHILEREDVGTTRAYLSLDRRAVVLRHNHNDGPTLGLVRISLDGSEVEEIPLDNEHHDFVELPDERYALLAQDVREVEGEEITGDKVVELGPDGSLTDLWSAWDHLDVGPDTGVDPQWGFSHANAIDHDPSDDSLLVSCRRLNTIFKIDRATGDPLWQLGGKDSTFTLPDDSTAFFDRQHQFHAFDGGIVVFDNGSFEQMESMAVEYGLDEDTGEAHETWRYTSDPALYIYALGDTGRLPSGNTLVGYSIAGQVDLVTPDNDRIWRLRLSLGGALGYSTWEDSLYPDWQTR